MRYLYTRLCVEGQKFTLESRFAWHKFRHEFSLHDIASIRCRHAFPFGFVINLAMRPYGNLRIAVGNRRRMQIIVRVLSRHPIEKES